MKPAMKVEDLCVDLVTRRQKKRIVDHVEFEVYPGECLGILGESGSGKSMSLKAVLGLLDKNFQVSGQAVFDDKNLIGAPGEELRKLRGNQIGMVLQNPMTCFDPLYRIRWRKPLPCIQIGMGKRSEASHWKYWIRCGSMMVQRFWRNILISYLEECSRGL